jgi:hypothetical protein
MYHGFPALTPLPFTGERILARHPHLDPPPPAEGEAGIVNGSVKNIWEENHFPCLMNLGKPGFLFRLAQIDYQTGDISPSGSF